MLIVHGDEVIQGFEGLDAFYELLLANADFKVSYHEKMGHSDVEVTGWSPAEDEGSHKRTTNFTAPLSGPKIFQKLMGKRTTSKGVETMWCRRTSDANGVPVLALRTKSQLFGIPMAEGFGISNEWTITEAEGQQAVQVRFEGKVEFKGRIPGARGAIEKKMFVEAENAFNTWVQHARARVDKLAGGDGDGDGDGEEEGEEDAKVPSSNKPASTANDASEAAAAAGAAAADDAASSIDGLSIRTDDTAPPATVEAEGPKAGELVSVSVVETVALAEAGGQPYTEYVMEVRTLHSSWRLQRRYRLIRALHKQLVGLQHHDGLGVPKFPKKKLFRNVSDKVVARRRDQLHRYFAELISTCFNQKSTLTGVDMSLMAFFGLDDIWKAASNDDLPWMRFLVSKATVEVDLQDMVGNTPLLKAAAKGNTDVVAFLLERGANANLSGQAGDTPLLAACTGGHAECAHKLLGYKAAVDTTDRVGGTPLHYAASHGFESIVHDLVNAGANVNTEDRNGETPLVAASAQGHLAICKFLLSHGATMTSARQQAGANVILDAFILEKEQARQGEAGAAAAAAGSGKDKANEEEDEITRIVDLELDIFGHAVNTQLSALADKLLKLGTTTGAKRLNAIVEQVDGLREKVREDVNLSRDKIAGRVVETDPEDVVSLASSAGSVPAPGLSKGGGALKGSNLELGGKRDAHRRRASTITEVLLPFNASGVYNQNTSPVTVLRFAHRFDTFLAAGLEDGSIVVTQARSEVHGEDGSSSVVLERRASMTGHRGAVTDLDWSFDDKQIVSVSGDGSVRVWESSSGTCLNAIELGKPLNTVRWDPSHVEVVAVGTAKCSLQVRNVKTGHKFMRHSLKHSFRCMAYSSSGKFLFAGDSKGYLHVLAPHTQKKDADAEKVKELSKIVVAKGCPITGLTYLAADEGAKDPTSSAAKTFLLVNCNDNSVRLYLVQDDGALVFLKQHFVPQANLSVNSCRCLFTGLNVFGGAGRFVASGSEDGDVYVFDISSQQLHTVNRLRRHNSAVLSVTCSSKYLASTDQDGTIMLWEPALAAGSS